MEEQIYLETTLTAWEDIFKLPQRFMDKFLFRGQGDSAWGLTSSLERSINKFYPYNIDSMLTYGEEKQLLKEFIWKYPLYSNATPEASDLVEWLTIMQHYGAPTRLIDITRSIFVAVYFALADTVFDHSSIWSINKIVLNRPIMEAFFAAHQTNTVAHEVLEKEILQQANDILGGEVSLKTLKPHIYYINPRLANERLARQQGAFLMPADITKPFAAHLKSYYMGEPQTISFHELIRYAQAAKFKQTDITILKINIPRELNLEIVKYLRAMNITSEMLFPGLDGLCRSLSYLRHEGMGNPFKL